jgi:3-hydroxyisobutyrate dehydrogenase
MSAISTLAFVGLGNMGLPMVRNLLKAGFQVHAFDLSADAMATAERDGARPANSMQAAVAEADCVFTMLPMGHDVEQVYRGENGLLAVTRPGVLLVDSSTISSAVSRALASESRACGRSMLDAPVSGGTPGAHAGTLTFIVGGEAADVARIHPVLESMGKRIVHVGSHGAGHTAKLCNNMLSGACMIATTEALALGEANGIDPAVLSEVLRTSSGGNYALERYSPYPGIMPDVRSSKGFKGGFRSDFQLKDMRLAKQLAAEMKIRTSIGDLACDLFELHCRLGYSKLDYSSVIAMLMKVPGELRPDRP